MAVPIGHNLGHCPPCLEEAERETLRVLIKKYAPPPGARVVDLKRLEKILRRETSCVAAEDVPALMTVVQAEWVLAKEKP